MSGKSAPEKIPNLQQISLNEYLADFGEPEKIKAAYEKAWDTRKFEIDLYWKRSTYFWAFSASALVGYFGLVNAKGYGDTDPKGNDHAEVYFVICLGFFLSLAWYLSNKGSKAWQQNWENQVDILEDRVVGPLHKSVTMEGAHSVSWVNEMVSVMFGFVWLLLGAKYFMDQGFTWEGTKVNWLVFSATFGLVGMSLWIWIHPCRGRFKPGKIQIYRRRFLIDGRLETEMPVLPDEVDFLKRDR